MGQWTFDQPRRVSLRFSPDAAHYHPRAYAPWFMGRCLLLALICCSSPQLSASPNAQSSQSPAGEGKGATAASPAGAVFDELQVEVGFGGVWKLGQVCPVRIVLPSQIVSKVKAIELRTVDGDGVEVAYREQLASSSAAQVYWTSARIGRLDSTLAVRAYGDEGAVLAEASEELQGGLASDQPLVLAVGDAMGVQALNRSTAAGVDAVFSTVTIARPEGLPPVWRDYNCCDLLVLSTSNVDFLRSLSEEQWIALDTWIRRGGGCVLSLSGSKTLLDAMEQLEHLQRLLPGELEAVGQISDPGVLESLVGTTEEPLGRISAAVLENARGTIELTFSDRLSREVPWWISYAQGHGTIQLVASDLGGPSFDDWQDRKLLWELLLSRYFSSDLLKGSDLAGQVGEVSYLGYGDLVGQLRATLDVFSTVQEVSFGQIAAILIGILILIGPVDYFVSVKWLQRPDFSWYFSGSLLLLASLGLTIWYWSLRPDQLLVNTAQVLDIDSSSGRLSGRLWSHVYSGQPHVLEIRATSDSGSPVNLDWQGLPGNGLGGLLSQLNSDRGIPAYTIAREPSGATAFLDVGIPAASTKCLNGAWEADLDLKYESNLQEIPGVDQLTGDLVNPLDQQLFEPMLFYHNWYYGLQSQLPPGGKVSISFDTIPKDLTRRLNGRQNVEGKERINRWDPADRESLDRLLEMMMFHKAASGSDYTSLTHRYQPHVDQSNLLETDRALLIGRIEVAPVTLQVKSEDEPDLDVVPDIQRIWCRISIPVRAAEL